MAATPEIIVSYLEHRLKNGLSGRVCGREWSGLLAHLREIQPDGPWRAKAPPEIIRRWLRAARKAGGLAVRKKPLLPEHFAQLADPARIDRGAGWLESLRNRALLLLGFGAGMRRSELVALDVEDVELRNEGAVLRLRRSKTDQEGKGRFVSVWRQEGRLCPVAALETYLEETKVARGPVFRLVRRGQLTEKRLHDRAVARIVKAAIASLGLDPTEYAGHSLRSGFVTGAAKRGATIDEIVNTTGHRNAQQVIGYIRRATPFERNASKGLLTMEESAHSEAPAKPQGYEDDLGAYGPVLFDMGCGEPKAWGFPIERHLSEERFKALSAHGKLACISMGKWCLVKRRLTPSEAQTKYGDVTSVERGPRGGFRSITYGTKKFLSRELLPETMRAARHVPACGRDHRHDASAIGKYCTAGECAAEQGRKLPIRKIAWRPAD
jgi:integrase